MMYYEISKSIDIEARRTANIIAKTKTLKTRKNYTGLEVEDRYYWGTVGELAFNRILEKHQVVYEYRKRMQGYSESYEYRLKVKGQFFSVDIKTRGPGSRHQYFMMPAAQYDRMKRSGRVADFYVGARIADDKKYVEFIGYIGGHELDKLPVKNFIIPTRYMPFYQMAPIEELIARVDHHEKVSA